MTSPFFRFLLSLTLVFQTASGFAQSTETSSPVEAIAAHAEGTRDIFDRNGQHQQVSVDVTVIQPRGEEDLEFANTEVTEKSEQAERENIPMSYANVDDGGNIVFTSSRARFLEKIRGTGETTRKTLQTMNKMAKADFIAAPYSTVAMVLTRGGVNFASGFMISFHNNNTMTSDALGGTTSFIESAILLTYGSFYANWFRIKQSYPLLLSKGFAVQFLYLAIVKASILLGGSSMDHGFLGFLKTTTVASLIGTIAQTPVTVVAATLADEYAEKNPEKATRAMLARNLVSVINSTFIAYLTYLQITGNHYTEAITLAVALPATVFVAYKQKWSAQKVSAWTRQTLSPAIQNYSLRAYEKYFDFITKFLGENSNLAFEKAMRQTQELKERLHGPTCRALDDLIDPS